MTILPFKRGKLPVKYLRVPLLAKKIGIKDYKSLINKVKSSIHDWKSKNLSYAGRAQLIASVLTFIQVKVSWKDVCQPKENRGLGLKPLEEWNKALIVKHLWNEAAKKDSFWVKWTNIVKLKGRSIWEVDILSGDSWIWKNLREIYSAGFSNEDAVVDCVNEASWKWPIKWFTKGGVIMEYLIDEKTRMSLNCTWPHKWTIPCILEYCWYDCTRLINIITLYWPWEGSDGYEDRWGLVEDACFQPSDALPSCFLVSSNDDVDVGLIEGPMVLQILSEVGIAGISWFYFAGLAGITMAVGGFAEKSVAATLLAGFATSCRYRFCLTRELSLLL
nr:hypothetical protein [Tanacetum cinerariifolium]